MKNKVCSYLIYIIETILEGSLESVLARIQDMKRNVFRGNFFYQILNCKCIQRQMIYTSEEERIYSKEISSRETRLG